MSKQLFVNSNESSGESRNTQEAQKVVQKVIMTKSHGHSQKEVINLAMICHETNRAYCLTLGDHSQAPWYEAPQWQKNSVINGVEFHLANPNATPSLSHENWLKEKEEEGWIYSPIKNADQKTHPCMLPFDQLPPEQQIKDKLFKAIVDILR